MARMRDNSRTRDEALIENDRYDAIREDAARDRTKLINYLLIIAALIAAVLAFIFIVPANYKFIVCAAAVILVLIWFGSKKEKRVFNMILVGALAVAVIVFFPQLNTFASQGYEYLSNTYTQTKTAGLGSGLSCALHPTDPQCFGEGLWKETKSDQYFGGVLISVNWQSAVFDNSMVYVPVSVKTDVPLLLKPTCFNEKGSIGTQPSSLTFAKDETSAKSVTCSGEMTGKVGIKIETDYRSNLSAPVWIGKGALISPLNAKTAGPYNFEISSIEAQPFDSSKKVFIKMTRQRDFNLTKINSFEAKTDSGNIGLTCPDIRGSAASLSSNFKDNVYTFVCDLDIISLPSNIEKSFITLNIDYSVEAEYKTTLNINQSLV